jgi:hypothetical protein
MRKVTKLLVATLSLAIAGAASAQTQLVHRVGDRWVFVISDSSLVHSFYTGQKVYFPTTTARQTAAGVRVGNAAVCYGRYSGSVSASVGSVEGRVVRLAPFEVTFKNTRGQVYRRATNLFVLSDCRFGPADLNVLPKTLVADEDAQLDREMETIDAEVREFLKKGDEDCLKTLKKYNQPDDRFSRNTYCT